MISGSGDQIHGYAIGTGPCPCVHVITQTNRGLSTALLEMLAVTSLTHGRNTSLFRIRGNFHQSGQRVVTTSARCRNSVTEACLTASYTILAISFNFMLELGYLSRCCGCMLPCFRCFQRKFFCVFLQRE